MILLVAGTCRSGRRDSYDSALERSLTRRPSSPDDFPISDPDSERIRSNIGSSSFNYVGSRAP